VSRSVAIAQAIADELTARRSVLDVECGPGTLTLVVKLGADGQPYAILFRPEWQSKPRRVQKVSA